MLYLDKPAAADLDLYYGTLIGNITAAVLASGIRPQAKSHLNPAKIKEILIDEPSKLIAHHRLFMQQLVDNYDETEYRHYFDIKDKAQPDAAETTLIAKYNVVNEIFAIFDYQAFLSRSKKRAYDLALKLRRNTCTYCNRLYTNTVVYKDPVTKRVNNDTRITRPQFDHWFAHSRYPLLGLSFYNLIPSCSVCNSSVKGDELFTLDTHIHPYIPEKDQHFKFSFIYRDTDQPNVKVIATGDKMKRHLEAFKIKEVYGAHSNLELKDLLDLKYKYSENYINTLFERSFKELKVSRQEAWRLIFGAEYLEADFHKRAFSKFKKDILNELGLIA